MYNNYGLGYTKGESYYDYGDYRDYIGAPSLGIGAIKENQMEK